MHYICSHVCFDNWPKNNSMLFQNINRFLSSPITCIVDFSHTIYGRVIYRAISSETYSQNSAKTIMKSQNGNIQTFVVSLKCQLPSLRSNSLTFATVIILLCDWRFEHAKYITMHVVLRKYFVKNLEELFPRYWYLCVDH